ncbi:Oidioi.mRNA.OKI2018_I69.PAR.g10278.t1.cds [Oikopleura dioica]|uniref:Oidioi.mRNA.OKI2018_I69.PAR.g10278.t1.cds n=1 Tax=Oikopleura dioica TaxID=34765 RepID=A0ABN7RV68_OIKDI|nr:Oidioi.mRNA.OKI2018_I69.PAR.g10278.t1.cds [Oikopleura dioica]
MNTAPPQPLQQSSSLSIHDRLENIDNEITLIARKVKTTTSGKLKGMKQKFEARQSVLKTEIECTKTIAKENENKATHLDTELRRLRTEGSELQRKLDELKAQNNEAIRLEQEIISQGKQNDEIIGEMADLKQAILSLSRTVREKAQELNESNTLRESMLDENATLKRERFELDVNLKSRERNLLEATREIAELERMLQTSNSSVTNSLSAMSTEL